MNGEVTIWFSGRIRLSTETHVFQGAEGDMATVVQCEIGHTGAVVEEAWIETKHLSDPFPRVAAPDKED